MWIVWEETIVIVTVYSWLGKYQLSLERWVVSRYEGNFTHLLFLPLMVPLLGDHTIILLTKPDLYEEFRRISNLSLGSACPYTASGD